MLAPRTIKILGNFLYESLLPSHKEHCTSSSLSPIHSFLFLSLPEIKANELARAKERPRSFSSLISLPSMILNHPTRSKNQSKNWPKMAQHLFSLFFSLLSPFFRPRVPPLLDIGLLVNSPGLHTTLHGRAMANGEWLIAQKWKKDLVPLFSKLFFHYFLLAGHCHRPSTTNHHWLPSSAAILWSQPLLHQPPFLRCSAKEEERNEGRKGAKREKSYLSPF